MRRLNALLLAMLAGCSQYYGITSTNLEPDAPPPADDDNDGRIDVDDNCPVHNPDQSDVDQDGLGDVCDNCPLIANRGQELEGDNDAIGTACDPHPAMDGDCLIVFDHFGDPATFADHWDTLSAPGSPQPTVDVADRTVTVTPGDTAFEVTLVARDDMSVRFAGVFDTQLRAQLTVSTGGVYATSNASSYNTGFGCGVAFATTLGTVAAIARTSGASGGQALPKRLTADPVDGTTLLRLVPSSTGATCRVEHGVAVGLASVGGTTGQVPLDGAPGMMFVGQRATVTGVALYRSQSEMCPPTIYR